MKYLKSLLFLLLFLFLFLFKSQTASADCGSPAYCDSPPGSCQPGTCGGTKCVIGDFTRCQATGQDPATSDCCNRWPYSPCCTPLDGNPPDDPNNPPDPTPGPNPTPPPGWGACGSCSGCGGPNSECQTDPSGSCVWNPSVCGGGSSNEYTCSRCRPGTNICESYTSVDHTCGGTNCNNCQPPCTEKVACTISVIPATVTEGSSTTIFAPTTTNQFCDGRWQSFSFSTSVYDGANYLPATPQFPRWDSPTEQVSTGYNIIQFTFTANLPPGTYTTRGYGHSSDRSCKDVGSLTVLPTPCTINLITPHAGQLGIDYPLVTNISNTGDGSEILEVQFNSGDTSVATVTSPDDTGPSYSSTLTPVGTGSTDITAAVIRTDGSVWCQDTNPIEIFPRAAWWQIESGKVYTGGNIASPIPIDSCIIPACNPVFNRNLSPDPVFFAGPNADFSAETTGTGSASSENWLAETGYQGTDYTYELFESLTPADTFFNSLPATINGAALHSGSPTLDSKGYAWYQRNGDLLINGNTTIPANQKIILLVNGNLTINGRINIANPSNSIILIIASGNINIDPAVAELNGVFFANGNLRTGNTNTQLIINGSVVANGGFILERNLGAANDTQPAELFEYNEDMMLNYPTVLSPKRLIWREVAP